MLLIKLRKANENGGETGAVFANTDQIVSISDGQYAMEVHFADGHTQYVKNTADEVVALVKAASGN